MTHLDRRRPSRMLIFIASLVLMGCASTSDQPDNSSASMQVSPAPEVIAFSFAWPEGLSAEVVVEEVVTKNRTQGSGQTRSEGVYRMRATAAGPHLRISTAHLGVEALPQPQTPAEQQERLALQFQTLWFPSIIVTSAGEVIKLADEDQLEREVEAAMLAVTGGERNEEFERLIATFANVNTMLDLANSEWNTLVAGWANTELELGQTYESSYTTPMPLPGVGSQEVEMMSRFKIEAQVPCTSSPTTNQCVRITGSSHLTTGRSVLQGYFDQLLPTDASITIEEFENRNDFVLITEPDTLLPHKLIQTFTVNQTLVADGEPPFSALDVRKKVLIFQYK